MTTRAAKAGMTESRTPPAQRGRRSRRPSALPVLGASLASFFALFGFMTYQLRAGHDPALGAKAAAAVTAPQQVVVKRIERRIIVTTLLPPKDDGGESAGQAASVPVYAVPAPATSAPAAPTVIYQSAPAPAPAPVAPVVTKTS